MSNDLDSILEDVRAAVGDLDTLQGSSEAADSNISASLSSFPTEMSCSQAFDQLLKCYSLSGQIRHYYRYGEASYCERQRGQFKFCLGTKLQPEEEKQKAVAKWYMKQHAEDQAKRQSSEEIWTARTAPLRRPFREDSAEMLEAGQN